MQDFKHLFRSIYAALSVRRKQRDGKPKKTELAARASKVINKPSFQVFNSCKTNVLPCEQRPFDLPDLSRKIEGPLLAGYKLFSPSSQNSKKTSKLILSRLTGKRL